MIFIPSTPAEGRMLHCSIRHLRFKHTSELQVSLMVWSPNKLELICAVFLKQILF